MKGLFVKDLLLVKNQTRTLPLLVLCGVVMAVSMQASAAVMYLTILGTMISVGTISYDEMGNGYSFLFTLPVTRKMYVREKYVFSVLFCLATILAGLVIGAAVMLAKGLPAVSSADELLSFTAGAFLAASVMTGSMIPVRLKYGTEKSSIALFVIFGVFAVIAITAVKARSILPEKTVRLITTALSHIGTGVMLPCIILLSLVILVISERLSERIVMRKEY